MSFNVAEKYNTIPQLLRLFIYCCDFNFSLPFQALYDVSYLWIGAYSLAVGLIVGVIVSIITSGIFTPLNLSKR